MRTALICCTLLSTACLDYGLTGMEQADEPAWAQETWDPPLSCASFQDLETRWITSPAFTDFDDPADRSGASFWDPEAELGDWEAATLPHRDIPVGADRAYVGTFSLEALPPGLFIDIQSDDGLWVWVNGVELGHWGGDWQQEGCVNDAAECLYTVDIAPIEVTDLLVPGENRLAARVSNPVANAWFELSASCQE